MIPGQDTLAGQPEITAQANNLVLVILVLYGLRIKSLGTHLSCAIAAELVHTQEGQTDALGDASSSHCCGSLEKKLKIR